MLAAFVDEPARVTPRADGPLVPRLRQLGHLRHGLLPSVRPHAARVGQGRAVGDAARRVRASARRSRCWPAWPARQGGRRRAVPRAACRSIERAAADERNFVKKGVSWALRRIGRRNAALHAAALATSRRLAASDAPAARWVGNDGIRDLTKARAPRKVKT